MSEVDTSAGLWPYAHNDTSPAGDGNGFWNDMDMLEIGVERTLTPQNQSDAAALNAARAHFSMWCLMKSPILLGNDLSKMSAATLGVLSNKEALAVSQDAFGKQASTSSKCLLKPPPPLHSKSDCTYISRGYRWGRCATPSVTMTTAPCQYLLVVGSANLPSSSLC